MAATVLYGALESAIPDATGDGDRLWIPLDDLERATGWAAKVQGLCRGDACVPIPRGADWLDGAGRVDFAALAAHLGHAVTHDDARGVWAFGPPADRGSSSGAGPIVAPDFQLPDLDGATHALSHYRGKKVLLYCWSSW